MFFLTFSFKRTNNKSALTLLLPSFAKVPAVALFFIIISCAVLLLAQLVAAQTTCDGTSGGGTGVLTRTDTLGSISFTVNGGCVGITLDGCTATLVTFPVLSEVSVVIKNLDCGTQTSAPGTCLAFSSTVTGGSINITGVKQRFEGTTAVNQRHVIHFSAAVTNLDFLVVSRAEISSSIGYYIGNGEVHLLRVDNTLSGSGGSSLIQLHDNIILPGSTIHVSGYAYFLLLLTQPGAEVSGFGRFEARNNTMSNLTANGGEGVLIALLRVYDRWGIGSFVVQDFDMSSNWLEAGTEIAHSFIASFQKNLTLSSGSGFEVQNCSANKNTVKTTSGGYLRFLLIDFRPNAVLDMTGSSGSIIMDSVEIVGGSIEYSSLPATSYATSYGAGLLSLDAVVGAAQLSVTNCRLELSRAKATTGTAALNVLLMQIHGAASFNGSVVVLNSSVASVDGNAFTSEGVGRCAVFYAIEALSGFETLDVSGNRMQNLSLSCAADAQILVVDPHGGISLTGTPNSAIIMRSNSLKGSSAVSTGSGFATIVLFFAPWESGKNIAGVSSIIVDGADMRDCTVTAASGQYARLMVLSFFSPTTLTLVHGGKISINNAWIGGEMNYSGTVATGYGASILNLFSTSATGIKEISATNSFVDMSKNNGLQATGSTVRAFAFVLDLRPALSGLSSVTASNCSIRGKYNSAPSTVDVYILHAGSALSAGTVSVTDSELATATEVIDYGPVRFNGAVSNTNISIKNLGCGRTTKPTTGCVYFSSITGGSIDIDRLTNRTVSGSTAGAYRVVQFNGAVSGVSGISIKGIVLTLHGLGTAGNTAVWVVHTASTIAGDSSAGSAFNVSDCTVTSGGSLTTSSGYAFMYLFFSVGLVSGFERMEVSGNTLEGVSLSTGNSHCNIFCAHTQGGLNLTGTANAVIIMRGNSMKGSSAVSTSSVSKLLIFEGPFQSSNQIDGVSSIIVDGADLRDCTVSAGSGQMARFMVLAFWPNPVLTLVHSGKITINNAWVGGEMTYSSTATSGYGAKILNLYTSSATGIKEINATNCLIDMSRNNGMQVSGAGAAAIARVLDFNTALSGITSITVSNCSIRGSYSSAAATVDLLLLRASGDLTGDSIELLFFANNSINGCSLLAPADSVAASIASFSNVVYGAGTEAAIRFAGNSITNCTFRSASSVSVLGAYFTQPVTGFETVAFSNNLLQELDVSAVAAAIVHLVRFDSSLSASRFLVHDNAASGANLTSMASYFDFSLLWLGGGQVRLNSSGAAASSFEVQNTTASFIRCAAKTWARVNIVFFQSTGSIVFPSSKKKNSSRVVILDSLGISNSFVSFNAENPTEGFSVHLVNARSIVNASAVLLSNCSVAAVRVETDGSNAHAAITVARFVAPTEVGVFAVWDSSIVDCAATARAAAWSGLSILSISSFRSGGALELHRNSISNVEARSANSGAGLAMFAAEGTLELERLEMEENNVCSALVRGTGSAAARLLVCASGCALKFQPQDDGNVVETELIARENAVAHIDLESGTGSVEVNLLYIWNAPTGMSKFTVHSVDMTNISINASHNGRFVAIFFVSSIIMQDPGIFSVRDIVMGGSVRWAVYTDANWAGVRAVFFNHLPTSAAAAPRRFIVANCSFTDMAVSTTGVNLFAHIVHIVNNGVTSSPGELLIANNSIRNVSAASPGAGVLVSILYYISPLQAWSVEILDNEIVRTSVEGLTGAELWVSRFFTVRILPGSAASSRGILVCANNAVRTCTVVGSAAASGAWLSSSVTGFEHFAARNNSYENTGCHGRSSNGYIMIVFFPGATTLTRSGTVSFEDNSVRRCVVFSGNIAEIHLVYFGRAVAGVVSLVAKRTAFQGNNLTSSLLARIGLMLFHAQAPASVEAVVIDSCAITNTTLRADAGSTAASILLSSSILNSSSLRVVNSTLEVDSTASGAQNLELVRLLKSALVDAISIERSTVSVSFSTNTGSSSTTSIALLSATQESFPSAPLSQQQQQQQQITLSESTVRFINNTEITDDSSSRAVSLLHLEQTNRTIDATLERCELLLLLPENENENKPSTVLLCCTSASSCSFLRLKQAAGSHAGALNMTALRNTADERLKSAAVTFVDTATSDSNKTFDFQRNFIAGSGAIFATTTTTSSSSTQFPTNITLSRVRLNCNAWLRAMDRTLMMQSFVAIQQQHSNQTSSSSKMLITDDNVSFYFASTVELIECSRSLSRTWTGGTRTMTTTRTAPSFTPVRTRTSTAAPTVSASNATTTESVSHASSVSSSVTARSLSQTPSDEAATSSRTRVPPEPITFLDTIPVGTQVVGSIATVVSALVGTPAVAIPTIRAGMLTISGSSCGGQQSRLDRSSSPLQLEVAEFGIYQWWAGAIIGNCIVAATIYVGLFVLALLYRYVLCRGDRGDDALVEPRRASYLAIAMANTVALMLSQPAIVGFVALVVGVHMDGLLTGGKDRAASLNSSEGVPPATPMPQEEVTRIGNAYIIAMCCGAVAVAWLLLLPSWAILYARMHLTVRKVPAASRTDAGGGGDENDDDEEEGKSCPKKLVEYLFDPVHGLDWSGSNSRSPHRMKFGLFFEHSGSTIFLVAEALCGFALNVVIGMLQSPSIPLETCRFRALVALLLHQPPLWLGLIMRAFGTRWQSWTTPFLTRFDGIVSPLMWVLSTGISALVFMKLDRSGDGEHFDTALLVLGYAIACASLAASFALLFFVFDVWQRAKNRRAARRRAAVGTETHRRRLADMADDLEMGILEGESAVPAGMSRSEALMWRQAAEGVRRIEEREREEAEARRRRQLEEEEANRMPIVLPTPPTAAQIAVREEMIRMLGLDEGAEERRRAAQEAKRREQEEEDAFIAAELGDIDEFYNHVPGGDL